MGARISDIKITKAQYSLSDRYPVELILEVESDIGKLRIYGEQKFIRYGYDLVFLGSEWRNLVPPLSHPNDAEAGPLRGFSNDKILADLTRGLLAEIDAGNMESKEIDLSRR